MPLNIVIPGTQPEDQFETLIADPTVRLYQCPQCNAVIQGTNADVYEAMTLFGKQVNSAVAVQRFESAKVTFVCPSCLTTQEFIRLDAVEADALTHPTPEDHPGKPESPGRPQ